MRQKLFNLHPQIDLTGAPASPCDEPVQADMARLQLMRLTCPIIFGVSCPTLLMGHGFRSVVSVVA